MNIDVTDFAGIYERLLKGTRTTKQTELAERLGIRQSSISDARRRSSIPAQWLLTVLQKHAVNPAWVLGEDNEHPYLTPSEIHPEGKTMEGEAG